MNQSLKLRTSIGSLIALGIRHEKIEAKPTTVYLMVGEKCIYPCTYCPQSTTASGTGFSRLSRVIWPEVELAEIIKAISNRESLFARVCIQVVNSKDYLENTLKTVQALKEAKIAKPISVSIRVRSIEEVKELFKVSASRVGLPLDVASSKVFPSVRGGSFEHSKKLILDAAKEFPARITTHIIVGLGETDQDIYEILMEFKEAGILTSLFAFTPVPGTALEKNPPPPLPRYRRIQLLRYLLTNNVEFSAKFSSCGAMEGVELENPGIINATAIYETSGCPGCNRPFYNESPGGPLYNYPFPPDSCAEIVKSYIEDVKGRTIFFRKD